LYSILALFPFFIFHYLFHYGFDLQFGQNRVNFPWGSSGCVEQKFRTRFFDEKDKRKVLRRNEDVNTKANVNKFDFLLNTFAKYCYIRLSSSVLRLNVILFDLRTKTTAKCRHHPTQSRSCVTHGVAYSYCHIFEF